MIRKYRAVIEQANAFTVLQVVLVPPFSLRQNVLLQVLIKPNVEPFHDAYTLCSSYMRLN